MSWNCINCEAANDHHTTHCEVCGYERYYSISEVNNLLQSQQERPSDTKKREANYKRATTNNKKLRKENKELIEKMEELEDFHENYSQDMKVLESNVFSLKKINLQLKIWLAIALLTILFFVLAKVSVHISF